MRAVPLSLVLSLTLPLFAADEAHAQIALNPGIAAGDSAKSVDQWITELEHRALARRWRAAYELGQIGEAAAPATGALTQSLKDNDFRVVWYSIYALGQIGEKAAAAAPALREALIAEKYDPEKSESEPQHISAIAVGDKYTRRFAAQALGRIGAAAKPVAPDLRRAMASDDASLRVAAALALWNVAADPAAIEVLSKMLASDDVNAAHEAALAFTQIGSAGRPAISTLVRALNSNTEDVRRSAARALGQLGPVALPALTEGLTSKTAGVRRAAAQGFAWLGETVRKKILLSDTINQTTFERVYAQLNATAISALRAALADEDTDVRRLAADAIGSIGPAAIPAILAALDDPEATVRSAAAVALRRIESRAALAEIRPEFAAALRQQAAEPLLAGIRSDDPFVRLNAVRSFALLEVAHVAPNARTDLTRLLKDDHVQVRRYASSALRQIRNRTAK